MQGTGPILPQPPQGGGALAKYQRDLDDYIRRTTITDASGLRLKRNGRAGTSILNDNLSKGGRASKCPGGVWG